MPHRICGAFFMELFNPENSSGKAQRTGIWRLLRRHALEAGSDIQSIQSIVDYSGIKQPIYILL